MKYFRILVSLTLFLPICILLYGIKTIADCIVDICEYIQEAIEDYIMNLQIMQIARKFEYENKKLKSKESERIRERIQNKTKV